MSHVLAHAAEQPARHPAHAPVADDHQVDLVALGLEPVREMAMGRPERTLVHVAERDEVDLVVVGHRGVSGMTRRLLGSVSEHVGHNAPCSVFIVRPSGAARA